MKVKKITVVVNFLLLLYMEVNYESLKNNHFCEKKQTPYIHKIML